MLGDFLGNFWALTIAVLVLWLAWVVVTHVRDEERKRREFFGEWPLQ